MDMQGHDTTSPHPFLDGLMGAEGMEFTGRGAEVARRSRRRSTCDCHVGPSRHPVLEILMWQAREEYANPDYVDAIILNFSRTSLRGLYAVAGFHSDRYGMGTQVLDLEWHWESVMRAPLKDPTFSEACSQASGRISAPAGKLPPVRNRRLADALLAPFTEVIYRVRHMRDAACCLSGEWHHDAEALHLPDVPAARTLLRLGLMPQQAFEDGLERLGAGRGPIVASDSGCPRTILFELVEGGEGERRHDPEAQLRARMALIASMGSLA